MHVLALLVAFLLPLTALAQPRAFKLGETDVTPEVRIDYVSNDNAFLTRDDPVEATGVIVAPTIAWLADRRLLALSASYSGRYENWSEEALNADDHTIRLGVDAELSARQRLISELLFRNSHEELGTDRTRGREDLVENLDESIEFNEFEFDTAYTYGAEGARGNVTGGLRLDGRTFSNQPELTEGDDFTSVRPYGIFTLRVSPDTRLLAELRYARVEFDNENRNRDDIEVLAGLSLSQGGVTGGSVKLGATLATFDAEAREDQTEFTADVDAFYAPVSYSRWNLRFRRSFDNVTDVTGGEEAIRDLGVLVWRHDWSARVFTRVVGNVTRSDRPCSPDTVTSSALLELNLLPRRWFEVGVSGGASRREGASNDCEQDPTDPATLDYTRQIIGAHVRVSL